MQTPISEAVQASKERRHLDRLETLIDSIYALVIVFLVAQFPNPLEFQEQFSGFSHFLQSQGGKLIAPLIGLVLMVVYWLQNNLLFGYLERTDNKHAILALCQLFFVLFYLYTADLLDAFPETNTILAVQSLTFALMGFLAVWGWLYATRDRRLIGPELDAEQIGVITSKILPEPITALITLPFAFLGDTAWNLSWLVAPVVMMLVVRRRSKRTTPDT
jgi:uncharacterized membrane protein